jgi:hypothetical protein
MRRMSTPILIAAFATSCAGDDATGPGSQYELAGSVLDDRSGSGLRGATVQFRSDTLDLSEAETDGDGRFSLAVRVREGVTFGTISAAHDSYAPGAARTVYFDGSDHVITLRLRQAPGSARD